MCVCVCLQLLVKMKGKKSKQKASLRKTEGNSILLKMFDQILKPPETSKAPAAFICFDSEVSLMTSSDGNQGCAAPCWRTSELQQRFYLVGKYEVNILTERGFYTKRYKIQK